MSDNLKYLLFILAFAIFSLVNSLFLWIPASAPPVLMLLTVGTISIWEYKRGNKA
jgi:hypothetical protein